MPRPARPRRGRSGERPSMPSLPAGARSSRMQRASRRRWERRPASAIPTIHGSGAPTRTPMAFSGTGSRRARASTMSATARCRRYTIHSTGDHASVSSGSAPGRSTTTSRCTCSEDSPPYIPSSTSVYEHSTGPRLQRRATLHQLDLRQKGHSLIHLHYRTKPAVGHEKPRACPIGKYNHAEKRQWDAYMPVIVIAPCIFKASDVLRGNHAPSMQMSHSTGQDSYRKY